MPQVARKAELISDPAREVGRFNESASIDLMNVRPDLVARFLASISSEMSTPQFLQKYEAKVAETQTQTAQGQEVTGQETQDLEGSQTMLNEGATIKQPMTPTEPTALGGRYSNAYANLATPGVP
jgi:hypothetical protein